MFGVSIVARLLPLKSNVPENLFFSILTATPQEKRGMKCALELAAWMRRFMNRTGFGRLGQEKRTYVLVQNGS
jgi:hypothetical protein